MGAAGSDDIPAQPFSARAAAQSLAYSLRASWHASRVDTAAQVVVPLVQSLVPAALALTLRGLINSLSNELGGTPDTGVSVESYIALSLALSAVLATASSLQSFFAERSVEALDHELSVGILEHSARLEFGYFENREFQDMMRQVRQTPGKHVHDVLAKGIRAVAALITIVTLLIVLARIEPRLIAYLVPLSLPFMAHRWWLGRMRYETRFSQNRSRRWVQYFSSHLMTGGSVPEARVLDIEPLFVKRTGDRLRAIRTENARVYWRQLVSSTLFNNLALVVVHIALLQATRRTLNNELTIGDIAIFATAAVGTRNAIEALFDSLSSLRWHLASLVHIRDFFALEPTPGQRDRTARVNVSNEPVDNRAVVSFDDVHFSYPNGVPVLRGVTFDIRPGETVGLVGRNGCGKSTLVKLIAGLYPPESGAITLNGVDTVEAGVEGLREHLSIVFQNFGRYSATVAENIAMGDWRDLLGNQSEIERIARQAGLHELVLGLPAGYDTLLGREFGEVSLSGGQWQRLAIARAFARDAPLMILDEPTANLDAESEYEVFEKFTELAKGRATLLISHRFSTLSLADRIVVLDQGTVVEQGTHAELVHLDGTYAGLHELHRSARGELER